MDKLLQIVANNDLEGYKSYFKNTKVTDIHHLYGSNQLLNTALKTQDDEIISYTLKIIKSVHDLNVANLLAVDWKYLSDYEMYMPCHRITLEIAKIIPDHTEEFKSAIKESRSKVRMFGILQMMDVTLAYIESFDS